MLKIKMLTCMFSILLLSGCATNALVNNMVIRTKMKQPLASKSLRNNIDVNQVTGGHETNPLWTSQINNAGFKEALKESLIAVNLYQGNKARYKIKATMLQLKQPLLGLDLKVTCVVRYKLIDTTKNLAIYNKVITASYTAKLSDDLLAANRLRDANEGAARNNITALIKDLYKLKVRNGIKV